MRTKQTVIVIGATGKSGSVISKNLSRGNYRLLLSDKDAGKLNELKDKIVLENSLADVETIDCSFDGCWEADIIISAVPFGEEKEVAAKIRVVANQKIVISFSNSPHDECEELRKQLSNSKVIKVFSPALAEGISTTEIDGKNADAFITGNDADALQVVAELLTTAGFSPVIEDDLTIRKN